MNIYILVKAVTVKATATVQGSKKHRRPRDSRERKTKPQNISLYNANGTQQYFNISYMLTIVDSFVSTMYYNRSIIFSSSFLV
jgi:hypothetical protein